MCMYTSIYIYIYIVIDLCTHIYIYRERERDRDIHTHTYLFVPPRPAGHDRGAGRRRVGGRPELRVEGSNQLL